MLTDKQKQKTDKALDQLLDSVHPDLAANLRKRFREDKEEFSKAAQEAIPSQEPSYWAKPGCRKCNGRGTRGTLLKYNGPAKKDQEPMYRMELKCSCTRRRYGKWLAEFRKEYNAQKAEEKAEQHSEGTDEV